MGLRRCWYRCVPTVLGFVCDGRSSGVYRDTLKTGTKSEFGTSIRTGIVLGFRVSSEMGAVLGVNGLRPGGRRLIGKHVDLGLGNR